MVNGPLHGVRIVDLTTMVAGPMATMILGDQGADVIKVEAPRGGDQCRRMGASRADLSAIFVTTNRNKRSVVLDLKTGDGLDLLKRLVERADVFVQNFRPGTADRIGVGEAALRAVRPDLVYVSISGFGEKGPYASKRVYDPVVQALSGLADIQADRDTGRPRMIRTIVPDKLTAVTAAQAITAALLARERTGSGQHLRLAMLDAMVAFLWPEGMTAHTFIGDGVADADRGIAQDLVFETRDGFITVGTVTDAEWVGLCRATQRSDWRDDPRFATSAGRAANASERLALVAEVLRTRSSDDWLECLDAEGVPCAPILRRADVITHPQVIANEILEEREHPVAGRTRQPRPAARFSETPSAIGRPAPTLGEHTDEVLDELGVPAAERRRLRQSGALG